MLGRASDLFNQTILSIKTCVGCNLVAPGAILQLLLLDVSRRLRDPAEKRAAQALLGLLNPQRFSDYLNRKPEWRDLRVFDSRAPSKNIHYFIAHLNDKPKLIKKDHWTGQLLGAFFSVYQQFHVKLSERLLMQMEIMDYWMEYICQLVHQQILSETTLLTEHAGVLHKFNTLDNLLYAMDHWLPTALLKQSVATIYTSVTEHEPTALLLSNQPHIMQAGFYFLKHFEEYLKPEQRVAVLEYLIQYFNIDHQEYQHSFRDTLIHIASWMPEQMKIELVQKHLENITTLEDSKRLANACKDFRYLVQITPEVLQEKVVAMLIRLASDENQQVQNHAKDTLHYIRFKIATRLQAEFLVHNNRFQSTYKYIYKTQQKTITLAPLKDANFIELEPMADLVAPEEVERYAAHAAEQFRRMNVVDYPLMHNVGPLSAYMNIHTQHRVKCALESIVLREGNTKNPVNFKISTLNCLQEYFSNTADDIRDYLDCMIMIMKKQNVLFNDYVLCAVHIAAKQGVFHLPFWRYLKTKWMEDPSSFYALILSAFDMRRVFPVEQLNEYITITIKEIIPTLPTQQKIRFWNEARKTHPRSKRVAATREFISPRELLEYAAHYECVAAQRWLKDFPPHDKVMMMFNLLDKISSFNILHDIQRDTFFGKTFTFFKRDVTRLQLKIALNKQQPFPTEVLEKNIMRYL